MPAARTSTWDGSKNGREFPSRPFAYFGQLHQLPELLIGELLAAGTFTRHPDLRILVCELGIDWLPTFARRADRLAKGAGDAWTQELLPSELLARQLRVSPLHTDPIAPILAEAPAGTIVFSSDFPHPEGGADARSAMVARVDGRVSDDTVAAFLGGTIAADLALSA